MARPKSENLTCIRCQQPRDAGYRVCAECRSREHKERYRYDAEFRLAQKRRYNEWRERNKDRRAEYQRERRARLKSTIQQENQDDQ